MNTAIVYLLNNNNKDIINFRQSIYLLIQNYYKDFPTDIICFHEQDFPVEEIELLQKHLVNISIKFIPITFNIPNYDDSIINRIPEYYPHPDYPGATGFSLGYRHMCRFFSGEIFKNEYLKKYKYIWRLDTDSYILSPINYNVFKRLKDNNAVYGYINIQHDHPGVIKGLWECSQEYFSKINKDYIFQINNIQQHKNRVFYTNFEICDMDWFSQSEYQDYYNYIDTIGGIYTGRWGDASIRYIALNSLAEQNQLYFYNDIRYFHQQEYLNTKIINTFNGN
jgi:alpha 1,2-mannosyltransferase